MTKILMLLAISLLPALTFANDTNSYQKIFKQRSIDSTVTYGSITLKSEEAEKKLVLEKNSSLSAQYDKAKEGHKKAMVLYKESTATDKTKPATVYKPSYTLEKRTYTGTEALVKMKTAIAKKNKREAKKAKKANK